MTFVRVVYIFYFKILLYPTPLLPPCYPLAMTSLRLKKNPLQTSVRKGFRVPRPGLEPGWVAPLVFETSASTDSAIWALAGARTVQTECRRTCSYAEVQPVLANRVQRYEEVSKKQNIFGIISEIIIKDGHFLVL